MTDRFDYKVVDTEHGEKVCVFWDDYDDYPDGIKQLPWEETHRSMYNPEWDDADDKIVHGKVDDTCWYIDRTEESIEMFERMFDTYVPQEYKPGTPGEAEHLTVLVPEGDTEFYVTSPPSEVDRILDAEFSYQEPNAEYTRAYKNGSWDGIVHIWDTNSHSAPLGLLPRAVGILESEGYTVDVQWEDTTSSAQPFDADWNTDYVLRPYQAKAVKAVLDNEGGIVSLPTGTGKTITALKCIEENSISRGRALVFVHTQELLYQWADEIEELLGIEAGLVGDGHFEEGDVTVAIMQTLHSRGVDELEHDYGQIIFDECHRTSAAETFHEIGMDLDCQYRIGLSATPWRRVSGEELYIEGAIGEIVHEVTAESMIDQGYLAEPVFEVVDPMDEGTVTEAHHGEEYHDAFERCIEMDPTRNIAVAKKAAELAREGHKVLVNVNRIAQGEIIAAALDRHTLPDEVASSVDSDKGDMAFSAAQMIGTIEHVGAEMVSSNTDNREEVLDEFENGDLDVVVSTLLKEGVDIPDISAIVLAHGQKSDIETIQTIGRALRPSNGDTAKIVDVKDRGRYFNDAFKKRQATMRDYYGRYYDLDVDEPPEEDDTEQRSLTEPLSDEEMSEMEDWITGA